ncbi:ABC transporter substrate-binding protein [Thalassotalea sp. M1531]|uniref:ABC transporter substrate-binding protein n=1 Tax=Thalassotalea algicola TaxID=2716224 RepID=A0A7Y0LGJ0_9GAMM|nr:ABC transporter substrate-binding protein [Thalassotalea algicola]NMP33241.1 ABC transporter substrate-binding protein [Thalassotalea algicola]
MINFIVFSVCAQDNVVKIGMSAPFSGPTQELGKQIRQGANAYFQRYNKSEHGMRLPIQLLSLDDGYEPSRTITNTRQFINQDKVFSLFSYVGTPTTEAIMPMLQRHNMLYFSPFTGAEFLRTPLVPQIYNIRGSYYQEAELIVNHFVKEHAIKKVVLFIQADAFGIAASKGYINSLQRRWITDIVQVRYKRNSSNVHNAIKSIIKEKPDVILSVGTYKPISSLINQLREQGIQTPVAMVSFAGAKALKASLTNFENVYISTVMPNPERSQISIIQQYRRDMAGKALSHESLEGYINAALFTQVLHKAKKPLTKESFKYAAENNKFDVGGIHVNYNASNHSAHLPPVLNKVTKKALIELD